jgi:hypothetical protein
MNSLAGAVLITVGNIKDFVKTVCCYYSDEVTVFALRARNEEVLGFFGFSEIISL